MAIDETGPEPDLQERARPLRREGMSVKQIVAGPGACAGAAHPGPDVRRDRDRAERALMTLALALRACDATMELRRRREDEERRRYIESVTQDVGKLSERELVIAGAVAHWAEGNHGCLVVSVLRRSVLYRQVEGIWFAVRDSAGR